MQKSKPELKPIPVFKTEDEERKLLANERDVPYQSLLKVYLADRVHAERQRAQGPPGPGKRLQPPRARPSSSKKLSHS